MFTSAADRFRLLGKYRTPRVRVDTVLSCEARDLDVVDSGYTDARISWPVGYPRERGGAVPERGPAAWEDARAADRAGPCGTVPQRTNVLEVVLLVVLYLMCAQARRAWQHRAVQVQAERFSLTFRDVPAGAAPPGE